MLKGAPRVESPGLKTLNLLSLIQGTCWKVVKVCFLLHLQGVWDTSLASLAHNHHEAENHFSRVVWNQSDLPFHLRQTSQMSDVWLP